MSKTFKIGLYAVLTLLLITASDIGLARALGPTPPALGGTGTSVIPTTGQFLVGQSNGTYLPQTVSTGGSAYPFPLSGNATSTLTQFNGGLTSFASTTVGDGTATGGFQVNGTSTLMGVVVLNNPASNGDSVIKVGEGGSTNMQLFYNGTLNNFTITDLTGGKDLAVFNRANAPAGASTVTFPSGANVGIGTTSPSQSLLTVATGNGATGTVRNLFLIASSTAISTTTLFAISNTGSTTAANGFNITAGCYAVAGTCLTTGGGSGSPYPFQVTGNATSTLTQFNGGLTAYATSTIGDGTQIGGLTVSGGATTTGNAYFGGTILVNNGTVNTLSIPTTGNAVFKGSDSTLTLTLNSSGTGFPSLSGSGSNGSAIAFGSTIRMQNGVSAVFQDNGANRTGSIFEATNADLRLGNTAGNITLQPGTNFGVGIGTTSPSLSVLTVATPNSASGAVPNLFLVSSSTASATTTLFAIANTGSTTASNGFNIIAGCYAVNGTCISTGGGGAVSSVSNSDSTLTISPTTGAVIVSLNLANPDTWTGLHTFNASPISALFGSKVGIGTTSPFANLSIHANNGDTNPVLFAVASSTASATTTLFSIGNQGMWTINEDSSTTTLARLNGSSFIVSNTTNTGFGINALQALGTGTDNVAFGPGALALATSSANNTAIGFNAGLSIVNNGGAQTALGNTLIGMTAGSAITGGRFNTCLGNGSCSSLTTGTGNTLIGNSIGGVTSGSQNILLGVALLPQAGSASNQLNIGNVLYGLNMYNSATTQSGQPTINGSIGIGSSSPTTSKFVLGLQSGSTLLNAFTIASSTAVATTTLFNIDNTGSTTATNGFNISAGCYAISTICLPTATALAAAYPFQVTGNATSTLTQFNGGLTAYATSTIGAAGQATGLTINGGATTTLNAYFASKVGIGTTSPFAALSIGSNGSIVVAENTLATSTSMTVDWTQGNSQLVRVGTSNTTIGFTNYIAGQHLTLNVCSPNASRGVVTFTGVLWPSGSAPTLTTTAQKCDLMTFMATNATSSLIIEGGYNLSY